MLFPRLHLLPHRLVLVFNLVYVALEEEIVLDFHQRGQYCSFTLA